MNPARDLEILVAKIQAQLAPDAVVDHDVRLPGRHSKRNRQIDVLVRQKIGQYEMLVAVECKDYARPVDVKGVEEFWGLLEDIGAQKGAMVCPKGFTPAAKARAVGYQIDLFSPIDTDPHKWRVRVTAPAICDLRSAAIAFGIRCSAPFPMRIPQDYFSSVTAFSAENVELGIPYESAIRRWNEGGYPAEPGVHEDLPIFDRAEVLTDNGYGRLIPVTLTASIHVRQTLYFGSLPIKKMSGFRDELSGGVITNAFEVGLLNFGEVVEKWTPVASEADAPTPPMLILRGLVGWDATKPNLSWGF